MRPPTFLQHDGKRILRLDYTGLAPEAVIAYMEEAKPVIAGEPPGSVRILNILRIRMTEEITAALKGFAAHNTPYVRASAIVGATPFQRSLFGLMLRSAGRQRVEMFDEEGAALDWLAAD